MRSDSGDFFESVTKWESFLNNEKIIYSDSLLGIVDILAFRSLVNEYKENAPKIITEVFASEMMFTESMYKNLNFKILSDTLIIYSNDTHAITALNIINVIDNFCLGLLKKGYLTRGAIVKGKHFIENDIMISPAFIDAHEIEEKICIYPRVIIDENIINDIFNQCQKNIEGLDGIPDEDMFRIVNKKNFEVDFDGFYISNMFRSFNYIHLLTYGKSDMDSSSLHDYDINALIINAHTTLLEFCAGLRKCLSNTNCKKEKMKVIYLITKYNKIVNEMKYDTTRTDLLLTF